MNSSAPATCQHELRPGTKVCLHCRRAEREVRAARQRAILTRLGLTAAAIGAVAYAGLAGYRVWQGQGSPSFESLLASPASLEAAPVRTLGGSTPGGAPAASLAPTPSAGVARAEPLATAADSARSGVAVVNQGSGGTTRLPDAPADPAAAPGVAQPVAAPTPLEAPAPRTPVVTPPPAALQPVVAEGRTELQNGIYALRRGDTVTVHFDTPEARTRRPEKFEQIVRATLPAVHGAAASSILAGIANGSLIAPGGTITEPQGSIIALRGEGGAALSVVPQTRQGRDGPLVIAYRVVPSR